MRNFQILIVSAVEFCKQCLQTASASGYFIPRPLPGLCPGPHWGTSVASNPRAIAPLQKNPDAATGHVPEILPFNFFLVGFKPDNCLHARVM